jgi:predicted transcriptional regulator
MMHKNESNLPVLKKKKIVGVVRSKEVFAAVCLRCQL